MDDEDIEMQSNSDSETVVSERNMVEEGAVPRTSQITRRRSRGNRIVRSGTYQANLHNLSDPMDSIRIWHDRRASVRRARDDGWDERTGPQRGIIPFLSKMWKQSGSYIYNMIHPRVSLLNEQQNTEYLFQEVLTDDLWNETICIPTLYENVRNAARRHGVSLDFILEEARKESDMIPYGSMLHYAVFHRDAAMAERGDLQNGASSRNDNNNDGQSPQDTVTYFNNQEISVGNVRVYPFHRIKRVDLIFSNEVILNCEQMLDSIDSSRVSNHMKYCLIIQQISAKAMYEKLSCEVFLNRWLKRCQRSPSWISEVIPYQVMLMAIYVNQYPMSREEANNTNLRMCDYVTVCHRTSVEDLFQSIEQLLPPEQIAMNNQILSNGQVTFSPGNAERQAEAASEEEALNDHIVEAFCNRLHDFTGTRLDPRSFRGNDLTDTDSLNPPHTTDTDTNPAGSNINTNNVSPNNGAINPSGNTANPPQENINSDEGDTNTNSLSDDETLDDPTKEANAVQNQENKVNMSIDDDDGQTCSICLESWTISGDHRLCALRCGHLFGNSCILRWLKQSPILKRACPSCKSKAQMRDIRFIFARKVITADNTEEETLKRELQDAKVKNARLEADILTMTTNQRMYAVKITELQREIAVLRQRSTHDVTARRQLTNWRYIMHSNIEISKNSTCRVLAYNSRSKSLYVSVMSENSLFPGCAMRKIDCDTWSLNKLLNLHSKTIRDASYSSSNDLLMTVALDKCIKIVQGANDKIITTIQSQMPLWSCCWDSSNTNRIWVGGVGGIVCEYDIRQPKTAMCVINSVDVSPVASLTSVPNGIVACRLNSVTAYRKTNDTVDNIPLPVEGTFTCVRSDPVTNDLLVSCRSSSNHPRPRHIYCKLEEDNFYYNPYSTFEGTNNLPLMSRSVLYSIDEQSYVSAYDGNDSGVGTWSVASGNRIHSLGANDFVVDMIPITDSAGSLVHLATLSQTRLRIHQVTPVN